MLDLLFLVLSHVVIGHYTCLLAQFISTTVSSHNLPKLNPSGDGSIDTGHQPEFLTFSYSMHRAVC